MTIIARIAPRRLATNAPSVMVVDDDEDIRDALAEMLERLGFRPIIAATGRDALDQLLAGARPTVMLLDLMMPVMDGYQLVNELRRHAALASMPVLIITAAGDARAEATKLKVAGHLQKPFRTDQLLASITRFT